MSEYDDEVVLSIGVTSILVSSRSDIHRRQNDERDLERRVSKGFACFVLYRLKVLTTNPPCSSPSDAYSFLDAPRVNSHEIKLLESDVDSRFPRYRGA